MEKSEDFSVSRDWWSTVEAQWSTARIQDPILPLISCLSLGKSLCLSLLICKMGTNNSSYIIRLMKEFKYVYFLWEDGNVLRGLG